MAQEFSQNEPGFFFGTNLEVDYTAALQGATFTAYHLLRKHPYYGRVIPWEITYDDLRGGPAQFGSLTDVGDKFSTSTMQFPEPGFGILPQAVATTTIAAQVIGAYFGASLATGDFLIGAGKVNGGCLFYETSGADPTPVATTYNPGQNITGIKDIVIGGAGSASRIAILTDGAAIDVGTMSAGTWTSAGAMHAATNPGWGMLTTPLNATTPGTQGLLIYSGTQLGFQPSSAAINAAYSSTLTGINGGGVDIGIEQLTGMAYRAFWLWPTQNRTASMYGSNSNIAVVKAGVYHTNLEGTDPLPAPFPLNFVYWACFWQRKLVATDGYSIFSWDGDKVEPLGIFSHRATTGFSCRGLGVRGHSLYAMVRDNSGVYQMEEYFPKTNAWLPVSPALNTPNSLSVADSGPLNFISTKTLHTPSFPISKNNGFMHILPIASAAPATVFNRWHQPPSGDNPFYQEQGLNNFAASGITTSPVTYLPGLSGFPSLFAEIDASATDPTTGGTAATQAYIQYDLTNQPASASPALSFNSPLSLTVYANDPLLKRVRNFDDNHECWNRFQWKATQAQSTAGTSKSGNFLPFTLRGFTLIDKSLAGQITPAMIRGKGYFR